MISFLRPSLICCLVATLTGPVLAQQSAPAPGSSDDGWSRLKQSEQNVGHSASPSGKMTLTGPGAPAAADYLTRADELKDFLTAHAGDARIGEARRLEALMLVYAGYFGDSSSKKRRDDLVAQVRADQSVPADDRFALASLSDYQPLRVQQFASGQDQLDQFEKTARALIAEFPSAASAYKTLLTLAKDCGEAQAAQMAKALLAMPAPTQIKQEAQRLLDRQALIGQPLKTLLAKALAAKDRPVLADGQIAILYAWAAADEGSLAIAAEIAAQAPSGATILGVNLDMDPTAARKVAAARSLPGLQFYDPAGPNSALARGLKLAGDNLAFITNRQGQIVYVSARPDLAQKIISAAR